MKLSKFSLVLGITVVAMGSCKEEEDDTINLLLNSNVERGADIPSEWFFSDGEQQYEVDWSIEEAFSPRKSLKISSQSEIEEDFAFWAQGISKDMPISRDIPIGRDVTLKTMIKGNLSGPGVSVAIRTDGAGSRLQFVTTQDSIRINGDFDWTEYRVSLDNVSSETDVLLIYLIYLPETSGEVYFDNITLTVE